jgi:medium-chain acyl-[acyl-carrier-protein] hydrolase
MYQIESRVGGSRTDTNGKLKLTGVLDYLQDCSLQWMESEQSFSGYLAKKNAGMFLVFRQIDIIRMPQYLEKITTQTSIFDCKSAFGLRNTNIYDAEKRPCILSWSIGAFVSLASGRMVRLTPEEIIKKKYDEKTAMEYLDRKIDISGIDSWKDMEKVAVRKNDIDFYHHMNNTKYVETALEYIPDIYFKRIRIEFKKPALPGDEIFPRVTNQGNKHYVELRDKENRQNAVVEFTV